MGAVVGRILGLDVGDRWVGIAVSDPTGVLASPLTRIDRSDEKGTVESIRDLIQKHRIERIVAGLPYSMDGNLGQQAMRVQDFLRKLADSLGVPIETWDERLSTVTANRNMIEAGMKRGTRSARIDAAAAALILQGYLDRVRREEKESRSEGEGES